MPDNPHYLRRVAPQHQKNKFLRWLSANLTPCRDAAVLLAGYGAVFDIDSASGVQLDVIGDIVGRKRMLNFEPEDGSSPVLDDALYRVLLKAKISINHWDGTIPSALTLWENLFPEYTLVIRDNQDMSINMYVVGLVTPLEKELMNRGFIAPKPQGVRINYSFVSETPQTHIVRVSGAVWRGITTTSLPPYTGQ